MKYCKYMQKTYNLGFDNVTQYPEVLENTTTVHRSIIFIVLHLVSMQSFPRIHRKLMERENPKLANFTKKSCQWASSCGAIQYNSYSEAPLSNLLPKYLIQSVNCFLTQLIIRRFFSFLLCCTYKSLL